MERARIALATIETALREHPTTGQAGDRPGASCAFSPASITAKLDAEEEAERLTVLGPASTIILTRSSGKRRIAELKP